MASLRANHLDLFPNLVNQSQYNRDGRALQRVVEALRESWLGLLDTTPVLAVGYKRAKTHSAFAEKAG